jgi:peptidoglycan/LPS O-acetylase OafA/YrhL
MPTVQSETDPLQQTVSSRRFGETRASVYLDGVRASAAGSVLLEHWRNIFFVDYAQIVSHRRLCALPYVVCGVGHQLVVIFFVLSGYLIAGSMVRMLRQERWSWRVYGLQRLTRLWIVLLPGLVLTAGWDWLGMHWQRAAAVAIYGGVSGDHVVGNVRLASGLTTWLGNAAFLQTVYVPVFGSDSALWSLSNEFWYYLLFPLGLLAIWRRVGVTRRAVYAGMFLAVAWFCRSAVLAAFPVWLCGVVLVWLPVRPLRGAQRALGAVGYVAVLYASLKFWPFSEPVGDWVFGAVTAGFLWSLLSAREDAEERSASTRFVRMAARMSFTLYVVHTPLLALLAGLILGAERWQPDGIHLVFGAGILGLVVAFSWLLAWATEFRTDQVRGAIERRAGWSAVTKT